MKSFAKKFDASSEKKKKTCKNVGNRDKHLASDIGQSWEVSDMIWSLIRLFASEHAVVFMFKKRAEIT